jgi:phenylpyruvate tautomerase PptA (4-oxalocrotonate tautomerase family)
MALARIEIPTASFTSISEPPLGSAGVPEQDVLIVLHEPPMHNWGVDGGTPASEAEIGFEVEI